MAGNVEIWPVKRRTERRRFVELPWVLHGREPRWAPPLASYERWRLDRSRNPFFREGGDAMLFLARRGGDVVGRITAHVAQPGDDDGWFGFFEVADDPDAATALVATARQWVGEQGCVRITGPASFSVEADSGVLVSGDDVPGVTGRQWQPAHYAGLLAAAGLEPDGERATFRIDPTQTQGEPGGAEPIGSRAVLPSPTGPYGDPRLVLRGEAGTVAAVPDIATVLRNSGVRSTVGLARRARDADWDGATVVLCDGDPAVLVPALCRVAAEAGYGWVISPWAPDERPAETTHRFFTGEA